MTPLSQVVDPNQITWDIIYFHEGIKYVLESIVDKPRSISFEFLPLIGQGTSAKLTLSSNRLITKGLYIYKERPPTLSYFFTQTFLF